LTVLVTYVAPCHPWIASLFESSFRWRGGGEEEKSGHGAAANCVTGMKLVRGPYKMDWSACRKGLAVFKWCAVSCRHDHRLQRHRPSWFRYYAV